ncbi:SURP and G-patch domain-containing protein 1-like isoform X1 [Amphibalanus amphitrite]|uniref:SURP and G-patch domain-containing protein 1-like isoform X1 n=1 Tax=Amphibalanus amphitrite TaxID=1232801 RepID=UPI001C8FB422|nr:SURP and G-patch domain-containing protein 1-like isoform X1 [Amphibalanus amphitrite]
MASRPNPSNKLAEMSRQQELIERRRQEIEQRRRAAAGPRGGGGGDRGRPAESEAAPGPSGSLSAGSSARRLFEAHKQSFLATQKKAPPAEPAPPVQKPDGPSNVFQNDGSFMEMFQRMQKAHAAAVPPAPADRPAGAAQHTPISSAVGGSGRQGTEQAAAGGWTAAPGGALHSRRERSPADGSGEPPRKRRSRWGSEEERADVPPVGVATPTPSVAFPAGVAGKSPELIAYAKRVFGNVDLMSEDQWKQCDDQMKMNVLLEDIKRKKAESERLAQRGKVKYEYDSDEETDGGTWEHKRRKAEMLETQRKADELTAMNAGKHHIGDFLPPDELERFMEKWRALKEDREPDMSDYREFKLKEDNMGFQMLKKMGWSEGQGLGSDGAGITAPVSQRRTLDTAGVGTSTEADVTKEDTEFDAYRKRMMLAYKFRPNPLNNPRRAYY